MYAYVIPLFPHLPSLLHLLVLRRLILGGLGVLGVTLPYARSCHLPCPSLESIVFQA